MQSLPSLESVSSPTSLYWKLSPAHCIGENWNKPGPQTFLNSGRWSPVHCQSINATLMIMVQAKLSWLQCIHQLRKNGAPACPLEVAGKIHWSHVSAQQTARRRDRKQPTKPCHRNTRRNDRFMSDKSGCAERGWSNVANTGEYC